MLFVGKILYVMCLNCNLSCVTFSSIFSKSKGAGTQSLTILGRGNAGIIPKNRETWVRFKNIEDGEVKLFSDGKEVLIEKWLTDCAGVKFPFEIGKTYRVEVRFSMPSKLQKLKARAATELTKAQMKNTEKQAAYLALKKAKSGAEFKRILEETDLPKIVKLRILETE